MDDRLYFVIIGTEPISTNQMYIPVRRGHLLASDWLVEFKNSIKEFVSSNMDDGLKDAIKHFQESAYWHRNGILVDIKVSMPSQVFGYVTTGTPKGRDASNMIKAPEDAFVEAIDLDDKYHQDVRIRKYYNDDNTWIIEYELKLTGELWQKRGLEEVGTNVNSIAYTINS